jgi:putative component of toxin-antitoxin plasmid stabilization module
LDWLHELPDKAKDKCYVRLRLRRLAELGHELRRSEADLLRDGIYELRIGFQGRNYRVLYFFHGNLMVVASHGLIKEGRVPPAEIDRAVGRMRRFLANPGRHILETQL